MTLIQGCRCPHQKRLFVAPFIALFDFSPSPKLGNKLFDQLTRLSGMKPLIIVASVFITNIIKYSEDDLQRIFKAVLEAWVPVSVLAPTPTLALIVFEAP